jgi:hypothetical protein
VGDDQTVRYGRVILLDPQFQIGASPLQEKQMPALDAVNVGRPDLPACDDPAQERPLRRNGKKVD